MTFQEWVDQVWIPDYGPPSADMWHMAKAAWEAAQGVVLAR